MTATSASHAPARTLKAARQKATQAVLLTNLGVGLATVGEWLKTAGDRVQTFAKKQRSHATAARKTSLHTSAKKSSRTEPTPSPLKTS